jgi:hypothetical protein
LLSILISKQEITDIPLLIDTIKLPQEVFCSLLHVLINAHTYWIMMVVIGNLHYQERASKHLCLTSQFGES